MLVAKAEEEARALQKKIQTIENELDQTQEALMQVNAKLEEKDKALQNVSTHYSYLLGYWNTFVESSKDNSKRRQDFSNSFGAIHTYMQKLL